MGYKLKHNHLILLCFCMGCFFNSCSPIYNNSRAFWLDNGEFCLKVPSQEHCSSAPPGKILALLFQDPKVLLLEKLQGPDAPWIYVYTANFESVPWYIKKGPLHAPIRSENHLNFTYIIENYSKDLNMTYENLMLGGKYLTRYFIPKITSQNNGRLYVVAFYSETPIHWKYYKTFEAIIKSVKIT